MVGAGGLSTKLMKTVKDLYAVNPWANQRTGRSIYLVAYFFKFAFAFLPISLRLHLLLYV